MYRLIALVAVLVSTAFTADEKPRLSPEAQFHYDVSEGFRLIRGTKGDEDKKEIRELADEVVSHLKESEPRLFTEHPKLISDEEINSLIAKLIELKDERHLMSFPIWRHYLPLWKTKKLNRTQKVFFVYFAQGLWWEHEENQRIKKNFEQANKAPEPTPGAVTPRATEGTSK